MPGIQDVDRTIDVLPNWHPITPFTETRPPFRDSNSRVGRLLSLMILRHDGLLKYPILYISRYLNSSRNEYIDLMYGVSSRDSIDKWILFIAEGLCTQAISTARAMGSLLEYKRKLNGMADDMKDSKVIEMLFRNPYINVKDVTERLDVTPPTASKILNRMVSKGILREVTDRKHNRLYCVGGILELLR